jgi:hypothetical protein
MILQGLLILVTAIAALATLRGAEAQAALQPVANRALQHAPSGLTFPSAIGTMVRQPELVQSTSSQIELTYQNDAMDMWVTIGAFQSSHLSPAAAFEVLAQQARLRSSTERQELSDTVSAGPHGEDRFAVRTVLWRGTPRDIARLTSLTVTSRNGWIVKIRSSSIAENASQLSATIQQVLQAVLLTTPLGTTASMKPMARCNSSPLPAPAQSLQPSPTQIDTLGSALVTRFFQARQDVSASAKPISTVTAACLQPDMAIAGQPAVSFQARQRQVNGWQVDSFAVFGDRGLILEASRFGNLSPAVLYFAPDESITVVAMYADWPTPRQMSEAFIEYVEQRRTPIGRAMWRGNSPAFEATSAKD